MTYLMIIMGEDGDVGIRRFENKNELLSHLEYLHTEEKEICVGNFFPVSMMRKDHYMNLGDVSYRFLLVKGEIIVPQEKKVVKELDVE